MVQRNARFQPLFKKRGEGEIFGKNDAVKIDDVADFSFVDRRVGNWLGEIEKSGRSFNGPTVLPCI